MPTDYARSMDEQSFFRDYPPDWFDYSDGSVDSPTGWFGHFTLDTQTRASLGVLEGIRIPETLPTDTETYYVRIDSSGNVWAYVWSREEYDSHLGQWSRDSEQYSRWLAACEAEDEFGDDENWGDDEKLETELWFGTAENPIL